MKNLALLLVAVTSISLISCTRCVNCGDPAPARTELFVDGKESLVFNGRQPNDFEILSRLPVNTPIVFLLTPKSALYSGKGKLNLHCFTPFSYSFDTTGSLIDASEQVNDVNLPITFTKDSLYAQTIRLGLYAPTPELLEITLYIDSVLSIKGYQYMDINTADSINVNEGHDIYRDNYQIATIKLQTK